MALGRISSSLLLLADLSVSHATLPRSIHTPLKNASYSAALLFLLSSSSGTRADTSLHIDRAASSFSLTSHFVCCGVRSVVPSTLFHILPAHQNTAPERRNESSKPNSRQPHSSIVITKPPPSPSPKTPHHSSPPCSSTKPPLVRSPLTLCSLFVVLLPRLRSLCATQYSCSVLPSLPSKERGQQSSRTITVFIVEERKNSVATDQSNATLWQITFCAHSCSFLYLRASATHYYPQGLLLRLLSNTPMPDQMCCCTPPAPSDMHL